MNVSRFVRWSIHAAGGFFLLVFIALLLKGLLYSQRQPFMSDAGTNCESTSVGVELSNDGYLEGVAVTNCETGNDVLLSYHVFDSSGRMLDYEGIRFPSVPIDGNQVGFFRIPVNSLDHYPAGEIELRFDWVRDGMYWFRDRYSFTHSYRFDSAGTPLNAIVPARPECHVRPVNFDPDAAVTRFEELTSIGAFHASLDCEIPDAAFLTYHLINAAGEVLDWDITNAQGRLVCDDAYEADVSRIANSVNIEETVFPVNRNDIVAAAEAVVVAGPMIACSNVPGIDREISGQSVLVAPIDDARIWRNDEQLDAIVLDAFTAGGSGAAGIQVAPAIIEIDARVDRITTIASLIPRILPADDYMFVPALIRVQRDAETPTPFRMSLETFEAVSGARYETQRTPILGRGYQLRRFAFRAPPEGVWNLNVGYVFDPYIWYSNIFPADGDRVVFINPLVFMLLVLLSLFVLRGLLRFFKEEPRWYGKVLTAGAMFGVVVLFGISSLLTISGFSALMVYLMLKFSRSRHRFRDPWFYFLLTAFAFGLLMEAFWSVHYADVYKHGVLLSACLHAFVALAIVLVSRRDVVRRVALAVWFALSGTLYLLVVCYLKFFGEPPHYSIYQYAGQAIDIADSALQLLTSREWLGIGLVAFSVVLALVTKPDAGARRFFFSWPRRDG